VGWASQEQAFRPVPQHIKFIVGWAGVLARQRLIDNGASISFETEISTRELLGLFHKKNISDAVERAKLHQIGKLLGKLVLRSYPRGHRLCSESSRSR
jgi:hypothetical protein